MPRTVTRGGVSHSFPDDATDQEIAEALASMYPAAPVASQADVRKSDSAIEEKAAFSKMLAPRTLSTKDKNLSLGLFLPKADILADESYDRGSVNLAELEIEIARTKDTKKKALLLDEQARLKAPFSGFLGAK